MLIENPLAELPERLVWPDELTRLRLHKECEGLPGDDFRPLLRSHTDTMGSRTQSSACRELERLTGLECKAVDRDGHFREITPTRADIQPGLWGRRVHDCGGLTFAVGEEHSLNCVRKSKYGKPEWERSTHRA